MRALWGAIQGLFTPWLWAERLQRELEAERQRTRQLEAHAAIVEDQRQETLEVMIQAAAPLEVIRAQDESKPYAELSPDLRATIRGTTDLARRTTERANRTWSRWPRSEED